MIRLHGYTGTHSDPRFIQARIVWPGTMPCLKHGNLMVPPACQVGQSASVQQSVFRHPNIVFSLIYARITESPKLFTIQLNPTINTVSPTPNPSALYDMTLFLLSSMMYAAIPPNMAAIIGRMYHILLGRLRVLSGTCGSECAHAHGEALRARFKRRWDESKSISNTIKQLVADNVREAATPLVESETSRRIRMPDMTVADFSVANGAKAIMRAVENMLKSGLKLNPDTVSVS